MKLLCKALNVDERVIQFGDLSKPDEITTYHFARNERGDLVCEVKHKEHLGRLLAIPEHYEIYDEASAPPQGAQPAAPADPSAPPPPGPEHNGLTRKQLEKAYEEKFGMKPHPRLKDSTLLAKLAGNG